MIQANELRVGNVVQYEDWDEIKKYHRIEGTDIERIWLNLDGEYWKPIILTPELLEKCGFEHLSGIRKFNKNNFQIEYDINGYYCLNVNALKRLYIKSMHQLQNLYFALTGEELTIDNL